MGTPVFPAPTPILQFFANNGTPNAGGSVLTQVGGSNYPTYQDSAGNTPLPNPIPLNSRGEISNSSGVSSQLFLAAGVIYTFTQFDWLGNQINQAQYVGTTGIQTSDYASGALSRVVSSIAALRALNHANFTAVFVTGYNSAGDGGGGNYQYNPSDTTSADNGGTIIVDVNGGRWYLDVQGPLTAQQFGAVADGATDNTSAFARIQTFVAAATSPVTIVFQAGIYVYATSPNWAVQNASYEAQGEVIFRYTGTGNAVIIDGGASGAGIYNVTFGGPGTFTVQCTAAAAIYWYVRAIHHSILKMRVGGGVAATGLYVAFAVCSAFYYTCSVNESGWYNGIAPSVGMNLDKRGAGETVSYCTFINPVIEGPADGIILTATLGNIFVGGTAEGCSIVGLSATAGAAQDRFSGMDFESNGHSPNPALDILISGTGIELLNCDTQSLIEFNPTAQGCKLEGGRHSNVIYAGGSKGNTAVGAIYNRFGNGSTYTDSGTLNQHVGVQDGSTYFGFLTGSVAFNPLTIANGASVVATLTAPGILVGMPVVASFSNDLQGLSLSAYVPSNGFIKVVFANNTGGAVTPGSGTVFAQAIKQGL